MDQAGWLMSKNLKAYGNITIISLPAGCPELNFQEKMWQFLWDNWLSNRVFISCENIVDHGYEAWNKLTDLLWRSKQSASGIGPTSFDLGVAV